jgi:hypothetical protein
MVRDRGILVVERIREKLENSAAPLPSFVYTMYHTRISHLDTCIGAIVYERLLGQDSVKLKYGMYGIMPPGEKVSGMENF